MMWKWSAALLSVTAVLAGFAAWRRRQLTLAAPTPRRELPAYYRSGPMAEVRS